MKKQALLSILCLCLISTGCDSTPSRTISVQGHGRLSLKPDTLKIQLSIRHEADQLQEAETLTSNSLNQVLALLKDWEVKKEETFSEGIRTNSYRYNEKQPLRHAAETGLSFHYKLKETQPEIVRQLSSISGLNIQNTSFHLADESASLAQARILAIKDARSKAEVMAQAAGAKLGPILELNEGGNSMPIPRMDLTMMKAEMSEVDQGTAMADNTHITITAGVSARFELK
jgi:uncharacterized protein